MSIPIVCYVTDRKLLSSADPTGGVLTHIRAAMEAGADWVQIREKDLSARELFALVRKAVGMRTAHCGKTRVIVNDRIDVAIAAGADGVHLRGDSMATDDVVRWCRRGNAPAEFLVGVSCHSVEETREAREEGASYVFFGPVFDTPSKRSFGLPQGSARLAEACHSGGLPVIAIGGVNEENAAECIRAGAVGIAAIRMFQDLQGPAALKDAVVRLHRGAG
jgi:thiamine-phosphate pyrophosphorylase